MQPPDGKDMQILSLLFRDSRASLRAIGREVDLGVSAVKGRIKHMVESGGIERFVTGVNPAIFGFSKRCVFMFQEDEMTEETMKRLRLLGKPIAQAEILGGLSWLTVVVKKKEESKLGEFRGAPKLCWVEDLDAGWRLPRRLSTTDLLIIKYLLSNPRAGIAELSQYASVSTKTVSQRLEELKRHKAIRFGIQINPMVLGVAQATIIIKIKEGTPVKTLDKIDEMLKSKFLYVRYLRADQSAIRCYVCARNVYEIEPARKTINSFEGVEATEEYLYSRTKRLREWITEEIEARLEPRGLGGRRSGNERPALDLSPVRSTGS